MHKLQSASPPLVFVWLGNKAPHWMSLALALNKQSCGIKTILISSRSLGKVDCVDQQIWIEDFYEASGKLNVLLAKQHPRFREGFWIKTSERFFVLEQYMRKFSCNALFHAELDNLVFDLSGLSSRLNNIGAGFFCPRDSVSRGIASLTYINQVHALTEMLAICASSEMSFKNDMELLGYMLQSSSKFFSLPTENSFLTDKPPQWRSVSPPTLSGIFDAAAMGQFLFGIDPKNVGVLLFNFFENENKGCDLHKLRFTLDFDSHRLVVTNTEDQRSFNVYNLHVHSKQFALLASRQRLLQLLENANAGKRSLISISPTQNRIFKSIRSRLFS